MLQKFSFRQLLVIAFLLIAALLGAASLRALFTLEELTLQSRDGAARSLELSQLAQSLSELSVSMERTSRQSVVLDDRVLRGRVADQTREATALLTSLSTEGLPRVREQQWRTHLQSVDDLLTGSYKILSISIAHHCLMCPDNYAPCIEIAFQAGVDW